VESFGTAHSNATVTVNLQATHRHGEYFRAELAINTTTALWQAVTEIGQTNAPVSWEGQQIETRFTERTRREPGTKDFPDSHP